MKTTIMEAAPLNIKKHEEIKHLANNLVNKGLKPQLVVIQVGNNAGSNVYIKNKKRVAEKLGIAFQHCHLPSDISYEKLKAQISQFNRDPLITSIIVQFPLPAHLATLPIAQLVDPCKDGDGIHPLNLGLQLSYQNTNAPTVCTPQGILALLDYYKIKLEGKTAVIIGRSTIVGKPLFYLLLKAHVTVTIMHTRTPKKTFKRQLANADIIICATGTPDLFTPADVKPSVIIVDVGIIRDANNKIRGDIKYRDFINKVAFISPVPGGVGPLTITMLMANTIKLTQNLLKEKHDSKIH